MLVFLDTEFTSLDEDAQLLSIALVSEKDDAVNLYREITGVSHASCDEFVLTEIIPNLSGGSCAKPLPEVAVDVWNWLEQLAAKDTIQLACDWAGDWAWAMLLLDVAYQRGASSPLPKNMLGPPFLIWDAISSEAAQHYSDQWRRQNNYRNHHALHDAANNRNTYLRFARIATDLHGEPNA